MPIRKILKELALQDDGGTSIVDFLKGINILKVSEMIAASWNAVKPKTLRSDRECSHAGSSLFLFSHSSSSTPSITHGNAVKAFDNCIGWIQEQDEANVYNRSLLHDLQ